jgi:hypothetical protein
LPLLEIADSLTAPDRMQEALQARRYALRRRKHGRQPAICARTRVDRPLVRTPGAYDASRCRRARVEIIEAMQGPGSHCWSDRSPACGLRTAPAPRSAQQPPSPWTMTGVPCSTIERAPPRIGVSEHDARRMKALERAVEIAATADPSPGQVADYARSSATVPWRQQPISAAAHQHRAGRESQTSMEAAERGAVRHGPAHYTAGVLGRYRARPATEASCATSRSS